MRRRAPLVVDPSIYLKSLGLLGRNPSVIAVPLLMAVIGIAVSRIFGGADGGVLGSLTGGLAGLLVFLFELYGFGVACMVAETAWRRGRASFDDAWSDARRRGGDLFFAAIGISFIFTVAQYAGTIVGVLGPILMALAAYFLIYAMPAVAIGGIPGGAAIQQSIEKVRSAPFPAAIATVAFIVLVFFAAPYGALELGLAMVPLFGGSTIVVSLLSALFQAIALGYMAFVLTRQYDETAFR